MGTQLPISYRVKQTNSLNCAITNKINYTSVAAIRSQVVTRVNNSVYHAFDLQNCLLFPQNTKNNDFRTSVDETNDWFIFIWQTLDWFIFIHQTVDWFIFIRQIVCQFIYSYKWLSQSSFEFRSFSSPRQAFSGFLVRRVGSSYLER